MSLGLFKYRKEFMLKELDKTGVFLKTMFDGYDFIQTETGRQVLQKSNIGFIIDTTYVPKLYTHANQFLEYCMKQDKETYIKPELVSKYMCGLYNTKNANDLNNIWNNKSYILFAPNKLAQVKELTGIENIEFYVCPAFDENGDVEGIGFRIKDPNKVHNAFKWIFLQGNNLIYGKDYVDKEKECYVVEGFRDYVALRECGYNVVGLGSVFISPKQKEYLDTLKNPILLLDNDKFGLQQTLGFTKEFRVATLVGTKEKDAYDAWIKDNEINIIEIA